MYINDVDPDDGWTQRILSPRFLLTFLPPRRSLLSLSLSILLSFLPDYSSLMARITRATFTLLYSLLALAQLSVAASVYEKRQESTDASDSADADVATVQTSTLRAGASYPFVCSIISGTTSSSTLLHWPGQYSIYLLCDLLRWLM